jgi:restriction system protein
VSSARAIVALAAAGVCLLALGVAGARTAGPAGVGLSIVVAGACCGLLLRGRGTTNRAVAAPPRAALAAPRAAPDTTLDRLQGLNPAQFEEFARLLMEASGLYRDVRRVGGSGDGGIDLTMRDPAGALCVVQCKRYRGAVGPEKVRDLLGVMARNQAREGYLITTGRVSPAAQAWSGAARLHVWDGPRLVRWAEQILGDQLGETIQRARG